MEGYAPTFHTLPMSHHWQVATTKKVLHGLPGKAALIFMKK